MYLTSVIVILCLYKTVHSAGIACEGSSMRLGCDRSKGETIEIISANYGRTDKYRCIHPQISNLNCRAANALEKVSTICDLRTDCHVKALNSVFGDPCVGTYKYLEIEHRCTTSHLLRAVACEGSTLHLECANSNTIYIVGATYGRTDRIQCIHPLMSNTNCGLPNSRTIVDNSCNSQTECHVQATNSVFGDPCGGTYKYLEVTYLCL